MDLKRFGKKANKGPAKAPRSKGLPKVFGRGKKAAPDVGSEIVFGEQAQPAAAVFTASSDGFIAGVRSAEPMITAGGSEGSASWKSGLTLNISGAVLLLAFMSMFCAMTTSGGIIPFLVPGALIFLGMTVLESVKPGKVKWIAAAVIAALLAASLVVLRSSIGGGIADLINQFYDTAEAAQAYIYKRIPGGGGDPRMGAAWVSCLIGLLASLPPAGFRRAVLTLITLIAFFAFAYYGLIPSVLCAGVLLAALLIALPKGNALSSLPLFVAVMLVFGAVIFIAPGENSAISRADENFRDRFALNSRLIQDLNMEMDFAPEDLSDPETEDDFQDDSLFGGMPKIYVILAVIGSVLLLIALAALLLWSRISRKRKALREGIDSGDPKTAVTAMFPYSVRWLRAGGIDTASRPFSELTPYIAGEYSQDYANRYRRMYMLWREAAYSDHRIDDEAKGRMEDFLKETTEMIRSKLTFTEKLRVMLKYSL